MRLALCTLSLLAACDPSPACELTRYRESSGYCQSSAILALRETSDLHVQQAEVDRIHAMLRPAWLTFPLTRGASASDRRVSSPIFVDVHSDLPAIDAAWGHGEVVTGVPDVDALFAGNGAIGVQEGSPGYYSVEFREPLNIRKFAQLAAPLVGLTVVDADARPIGGDIVVQETDRGALATFTIGWGDCFIQCDGWHTWTVWLPPDGTAALVGDEGDPIPPYELDRIAALPPP